LPRLDGLEPRIAAVGPGSVELSYPGRATAPSFVPVFVAMDGVVACAGRQRDGATVDLEHEGGWMTRYAALQHLLTAPADRRRRQTRVRAGEVLGHARRSDLRVRFALFRLTNDGWIAVDPIEQVRSWSLVPWFTEPTSRAPIQRAARGDPGGASAESIGAALDRTIRPKLPTLVRS